MISTLYGSFCCYASVTNDNHSTDQKLAHHEGYSANIHQIKVVVFVLRRELSRSATRFISRYGVVEILLGAVCQIA